MEHTVKMFFGKEKTAWTEVQKEDALDNAEENDYDVIVRKFGTTAEKEAYLTGILDVEGWDTYYWHYMK